MSMQDPIADMLTRIRNNLMAKKLDVTMPSSNVKVAVAKVLESEGYINGLSVEEKGDGKKDLNIILKYEDEARTKPVIAKLKRVSKPGLRVYKSKEELPKVLNGLGVAVISTPSGMVSDRDARRLGVGGEVVCFVE